MELGETVILVNSAPIHSCFYDVFNRHFAVIAIGSMDDVKKGDDIYDEVYLSSAVFSNMLVDEIVLKRKTNRNTNVTRT